MTDVEGKKSARSSLVVGLRRLTEENNVQSTVFLNLTGISIKTFTFITASR